MVVEAGGCIPRPGRSEGGGKGFYGGWCVVGKVECDIWRRRCLGSGARAKRKSIRRTHVRFHHRVACSSVRIHLKRGASMRREYLYLEAVMATVGLEEMDTYALRLHNIITQYTATRTIL